MKRAIWVLLVAGILGATGCYIYVPYDETRPRPPRETWVYEDVEPRGVYGTLDIGFFYEYLEPYGWWVSYSPYGYVWVPRGVDFRWRPYSRGHWVWTDYGWTWVSLERWGWIAFHYGRWGWDRRLGWFWVPDILWGPAWVAWRWGDSHIGWAPLPPGIDLRPGRGLGRRDWDIPGHHWSFVRGRDFLDRSLERWILPVERNVTIIRNTVINVNVDVRDDRVVNHGVDVEFVQRVTQRSVERMSLKEAPRPTEDRIEGRDVVIYRPQVKPSEAARPRQVVAPERAAEEVEAERDIRVYQRVPRAETAVLRKTHEEEARLMEESQRAELEEARRLAEEEMAKIQDPEKKRKIDDDFRARIQELKKRHQDEKAELAKRQKDEEQKVKSSPVRRKVDRN